MDADPQEAVMKRDQNLFGGKSMKMRKSILAAAVLLVLVFMQGEAGARVFFKGKDLVPLMREYEKARPDANAPMVATSEQLASSIKPPVFDPSDARAYRVYIMGVQDALLGVLWDSPETVTVAQVCDIVMEYINKHPDEWEKPAALLVMNALMAVFPQPQKK
jgi:hypothetical protein